MRIQYVHSSKFLKMFQVINTFYITRLYLVISKLPSDAFCNWVTKFSFNKLIRVKFIITRFLTRLYLVKSKFLSDAFCNLVTQLSFIKMIRVQMSDYSNSGKDEEHFSNIKVEKPAIKENVMIWRNILEFLWFWRELTETADISKDESCQKNS